MRIFLAPPIDNKPLQESLKNLGAKQKQIDAWMIAVNNYKHMKHSSQEILQENNSQELLQELSFLQTIGTLCDCLYYSQRNGG